MKKKVLILSGGISKERLISLDTGQQVARELKKNGYRVKIIEPDNNLEKNINGHQMHIEGKKLENNKYIVRIQNYSMNKDSIKIINKTLGKIVNYDSTSMIEYNIRFSVKIIKPTIDDIIECYISEKNNML